MLRTHRAGKGSGSCGGWGLGSRNRRGPGVPPTPGLRGEGTSPGSPAGFLGSSAQGRHPPLLSSPAPPVGSAHLLLLTSQVSLLCPQGPTWPGGALEGRGSAWELSSLPVPQWAEQMLSAPLPFLLDGPSCLPLLISPALGVPILSGLYFSSSLSPPTTYWFTLGCLPSPWASKFPTSSRQVT